MTETDSAGNGSSDVDVSTTLMRLRADAPVDAQALVDELFATLSPRFHGLRKLGQGGMGTVYVARDPLLKRDVAIKLLAPAYGADPTAHARFMREAQAAAAVAHPNVVSVFQVGELPTSRVPYFVMQYIEGQTLEQAFPKGVQVAEPVARRIISEIAAALGAAHARDLVHRDIKPANVMLDPHTGRAIVLDFGISASAVPQAVDEKLTAQGMYVGTPRYMSPEQTSGEPVTEKSDVYSLGCVAYELLTGQPVFEAKNAMALMAAHMRDTPKPVTEVRPGLDRELAALVMRCLEKDPDKRPAAAEMSQRLTPGGSVLLEWPPPGLEGLHRGVHRLTRTVWQGSALLLAVGLPLVIGGPRLPSIADSTGMMLLLLLGLFSTVLLVMAAWQAVKLGRGATAAVEAGYGWFTMVEVLADPDGESGDIITGSRRFSELSAAQRDRLRRARVERAAALLVGGLAPVPVLLVSIVLASFVGLPYSVVLASLLVPLAGAWFALRRRRQERRLAPAQRRAPSSVAVAEAERLAPIWYEAFTRARVGQTLGAGWRSRARIGWLGAAVVVAVAVIVWCLLLPMATVATAGSALYAIAMPLFANTLEKTRIAAVARPYALPHDPRITPWQAGEALFALQKLPKRVSSVRFRPQPPRSERPWANRDVNNLGLFRTAKADAWMGPSNQKILEAVAGGFSADEMSYLRMVAAAPQWRDWGVVARAGAGDLIGPRIELPFAADASIMDFPIVAFASTKEMAYASVARAAYYMARHLPDSAELVLKETISAGFFLADNAQFLIEELIGDVIVGIGRDALTRFYLLTGNPLGPRLQRDYDVVRAAVEARRDGDAVNPIDRMAPDRSAPSARRRVVALASAPAMSRALRLEMLHVVGMAPCTNVRELVFGPNEDVSVAFDRARRELARYAADTAFVDLLEHTPERGFRRDPRNSVTQSLVVLATRAGWALHNPRMRGCAEIVTGGFFR